MFDSRRQQHGFAAGWLEYASVDGLPLAVEADRYEISGRAGRLAYYVAGQGTPLLLLHSINAAASAFEMRTLFERMRSAHRVYAIDLPGFGASERSSRDYSVALYVKAVYDMLDVIARAHGPECRVNAVALSLAAEFLARVTAHSPGRFRSLALVNPTGFESSRRSRATRPWSTREVPGMHAVLSMPLWGQTLFNLLVSRPSIRFFLRRSWGSDRVDEALVEYAYVTAHQPGARHAPFAFVSGRLFSADIRQVYGQLTLPVWMPHGTRGSHDDFSGADWVRERSNWSVESFDTGAMPHYEHADAFARRYQRFLASVG